MALESLENSGNFFLILCGCLVVVRCRFQLFEDHFISCRMLCRRWCPHEI